MARGSGTFGAFIGEDALRGGLPILGGSEFISGLFEVAQGGEKFQGGEDISEDYAEVERLRCSVQNLFALKRRAFAHDQSFKNGVPQLFFFFRI